MTHPFYLLVFAIACSPIQSQKINKQLIFGASTIQNVKDYFKSIEFKIKTTGGLSCGDRSPLWDSSTMFSNDSLGIEISLSASWVENTQVPEETLENITFKKPYQSLFNCLPVGSFRNEVIQTHGKGGKKGLGFIKYPKLGLTYIVNQK